MSELQNNGKDSQGSKEKAAQLLDQVRQVAAELRPHLAKAPVTLDSSLDKDLGLDSLARVEVMVRIERHFGMTLPEQVFATSETPREILRAILGGAGTGDALAALDISEILPEASGDLPHAAQTLTEVLDWHCRFHPDRPHIRLYSDDGEGEVITFQDLKTGAEKVAAGLQQGNLQPGQSVVIMLPTGRDYFFSFFGVLYAGGVPVPIYPPGRPNQLEEHLIRHAAIVENCLAGAMITVPEAKVFTGLLAAQVECLLEVVTVEELMARAGPFAAPVLKSGDIAFLQYTSGSTGNPKGVLLTHANLLANIRAMGEALEATSRDVFVSWLPLYHDMGLIGAWFGNLYHASLLVIMPPLSFLSRPERWLRAIHRARGTLSAAPNFAYELCLKRIGDKTVKELDLSSWRLVLNGAEAINPDTMQRFQERFGECGLRTEAIMPVYGLAECSVGLSFPPLDRGLVTDRIRRDVFMTSGVAETAEPDDAQALVFVNCGRPLAGHQIRMVDAAGRELPERHEGRLQFQGPSATSGYYRNAAETALLFDGDWLNSGDLAYIAGGDVFITGRTKDIIIRGGRNIYPAEIEDAVGGLDGAQKGNIAVFGSADPKTGTERLVVMAETRKRKPGDQEQLRSAINALALDLIGAPPDDVVLVPPRTVLKTSSGKIRRKACRELYEQGLIGKPPAAVWLQLARLSLASVVPRARRLLQGLGGWLFAAYACGLFALLAPAFWVGSLLVFPLNARWVALRYTVRAVAWLLAIRFRVVGLENLPSGAKASVYVSNHASYLDGFVLSAALPRPVRFVAKAELRESWITRIPLERIEAVFVERFDRGQGVEDAGQVTEALREGHSPLFFAEGTFSRMPGLLPFYMGAFATAAEAEAPIVPVIIRGTRSILRDGTWMPRPGAITVIIGKPIEPEPKAGKDDDWHRAVRLRDLTRAEILKHSGEPDLAREQSPKLALKE